MIQGAVNVSGGMLEFRAYPDSPSFNSTFEPNTQILV